MEFRGFTEADFGRLCNTRVGIAPMEALKAHLRPKLGQLGRDVSTYLSELWESRLSMPMWRSTPAAR